MQPPFLCALLTQGFLATKHRLSESGVAFALKMHGELYYPRKSECNVLEVSRMCCIFIFTGLKNVFPNISQSRNGIALLSFGQRLWNIGSLRNICITWYTAFAFSEAVTECSYDRDAKGV